mmetsp:Transcript_17354/g.48689  ORF Transcript_17354/g.48689 Transcript_17354/m.48689 type:complete len:128 (+) Transcript_17354:1607-1990(+)
MQRQLRVSGIRAFDARVLYRFQCLRRALPEAATSYQPSFMSAAQPNHLAAMLGFCCIVCGCSFDRSWRTWPPMGRASCHQHRIPVLMEYIYACARRALFALLASDDQDASDLVLRIAVGSAPPFVCL